MADWKMLMANNRLDSWKELMAFLKVEHGMGHAQANALVVDFLEGRKKG